MKKKTEYHVVQVHYEYSKQLKNGSEIRKELEIAYEIYSELVSSEELDALDISPEIAQIIYESDRQLINAENYENKHQVMRYDEGVSELAMLMDSDAVFSSVLLRYDYERVKQAMKILSPQQRKRIYLHYGMGYSYWEIADKEGVSRQCVRESIRNAKKRIMNIL